MFFRSILDTIKHPSFISFLSIFFFIIFSFAFAYYIAFGVDIISMQNYYDTLIFVFQMIFGSFDYTDMVASNTIIGPVLFVAFIFFVCFILFNMAIAVLSDIYVSVSGEHKEFWHRHLTQLVIDVKKTKILNSIIFINLLLISE